MKVYAIAVSDIHLSLTPPIARAAEPDWLAVQARGLDRLRDLQHKHKDVPILIAGDVFDTWKVPPQLINMALNHIPPYCWAIPGQHDLPNHSLEEIDRSAYQTLVLAGRLRPITHEGAIEPTERSSVWVGGFPWGSELAPCKLADNKRKLHGPAIAMVHRFLWDTPERSYPGAPVTKNVRNTAKELKGWDFGIFGDNHQPFHVPAREGIGYSEPMMVNCGGYFRRHSDEQGRDAFAWLLGSSGGHWVAKPVVMTDEQDKFVNIPEELKFLEQDNSQIADFITSLADVGTSAVDFLGLVHTCLKQVDLAPAVRKAILSVLEAR